MEKSPQTDVERVVCLAFYLAHYRDVRYFKTADVSKLNTEAAQRKLANTTYSINTATQAGYIAPATKNAKQLSAMGERFVQALPDHAAAKDIRTSMRPKRARKKTSPRKQNTHIGRDDEE